MTQRDEHLKTLQESAGERDRVLPMLKDYMARSGLTLRDFARRINYSAETLHKFHNDKYHQIAGTHGLLCRAIEQFIQDHPLDAPNEALGDLYETANVRIIRGTIDKLLQHPVGYVIYGPPGSQKSFTLEHEIARLTRAEQSRRTDTAGAPTTSTQRRA